MVGSRALRAVPAWGWLAAVVGLSFLFRAWLARGMVAPFIMTDELTYAELSRSLADTGRFAVRGVPSTGYSIVYPALISPAYALFDRLPEAYTAVKTMNSLMMSLAAVPAYALARRVASQRLALLGAVLAVAIPSMAYTGTVLTENAFYPLLLAIALMLVRVFERPTALRQIAFVVLLGLAIATRVQAVVLLPGALTAPLLLAVFQRDGLRGTMRRFLPLYGIVVGGGLLVLGLQVARGRPITGLLGAYQVVGESSYDVVEVLRFLLYHWAELDLYLGVVPFAVTIVLIARARSLDAPLQRLLAVTLGISFWLVLAVAVFASKFADRIQERNTFELVPLFTILLLGWVERDAPRPRVTAIAAAAVAALGILAIPFERFVTTSAVSDTLMLLPWWAVQNHTGLEWVAEIAFGFAVAVAVLFLAVPRRYAIVLPLVLLAYLAIVFKPIWFGPYPYGFRQASVGALYQGMRGVPRDWIDRAVPEGAEVAVFWTEHADRFTVNENEFFNRSVGTVYDLAGPTPGGVGEIPVTVDRDNGVVRRQDGTPLSEGYLLADDVSIEPVGTPIARDALMAPGITLWRLEGPLVSTIRISGLYDDTWSAGRVTWLRRHCLPGSLTVSLSSDDKLFASAQTVTASTGRRVRFEPDGTATLTTPVRPRSGVCRVVFTVSPTAVPARVIDGSTDDRVLGAHFNRFAYEPS